MMRTENLSAGKKIQDCPTFLQPFELHTVLSGYVEKEEYEIEELYDADLYKILPDSARWPERKWMIVISPWDQEAGRLYERMEPEQKGYVWMKCIGTGENAVHKVLYIDKGRDFYEPVFEAGTRHTYEQVLTRAYKNSEEMISDVDRGFAFFKALALDTFIWPERRDGLSMTRLTKKMGVTRTEFKKAFLSPTSLFEALKQIVDIGYTGFDYEEYLIFDERGWPARL